LAQAAAVHSGARAAGGALMQGERNTRAGTPCAPCCAPRQAACTRPRRCRIALHCTNAAPRRPSRACPICGNNYRAAPVLPACCQTCEALDKRLAGARARGSLRPRLSFGLRLRFLRTQRAA